MARLAILVSREGRFMRPLLDSAFFKEVKGLEIAGVVSSSPNASALVRARNMKAPCYVVDRQMFPNDASYGMALLQLLKDIDTDFVVLDDFIPQLGQAAKHYAGKVMGVKLSCEEGSMKTTVYLTNREGQPDRVLAAESNTPCEGDDLGLFEKRVKEQAFSLLIGAIRDFCEK